MHSSFKYIFGSLLLIVASPILAQDKISIYELILRSDPDFQEREVRKRYEIRSLFIKQGSDWIVNSIYEPADSFYMVSNGKITGKISGVLSRDTIDYKPEKEYYYAPKPRITLNKKFDRSLEVEVPWILKSAFLTTDSAFTRNTQFREYKRSQKDIELIKSTFYPYIRKQYSRYCIQNKSRNFPEMTNDSLLQHALPTLHIKFNASGSFSDQDSNRLISFMVPYDPRYRDIYPFNGSCFREDNAYEGLEITCYITKDGDIRFLQDKLEYMDHGDFDGDGKDEFLF